MGSKVNPDQQLEDEELHQGLPVEINTNVSDKLVKLPKIILRRTLLQAKYSIEKED